MKLSNSIKDKVGHINTSKKQNKGKIFYMNTKLKQKKKEFFYFNISKNCKPRGPNDHWINMS